MARRVRRVGTNSAGWRLHLPRPVKTLADASPGVTVDHVSFYTTGNAGDTVLVSAVRRAFEIGFGGIEWRNQHVHWRFGKSAISKANSSDLVLIGGGGLLLADTRPNQRSGWQWNADIDAVGAIRTPLVVFAVGYNRFRGQDDFASMFRDHLTKVAERSVYIGLRNTGSIEAVRSYLPAVLHDKLRFQPCPTTVLSRLEPSLVDDAVAARDPRPVVGVNLAFDRAGLRFGDRVQEILDQVTAALRVLEDDGARIVFFAQCPEDELTVPALRGLKTLELVRLYGASPREVAVAYGTPSVVLGMRGHAQMIPFGMCTPIVSLVTHDKLRFFLDDVRHPEWGVEASDPQLTTELVERLRAAIDQGDAIRDEINVLQDELWQRTIANVRDARPTRDHAWPAN